MGTFCFIATTCKLIPEMHPFSHFQVNSFCCPHLVWPLLCGLSFVISTQCFCWTSSRIVGPTILDDELLFSKHSSRHPSPISLKVMLIWLACWVPNVSSLQVVPVSKVVQLQPCENSFSVSYLYQNDLPLGRCHLSPETHVLDRWCSEGDGASYLRGVRKKISSQITMHFVVGIPASIQFFVRRCHVSFGRFQLFKKWMFPSSLCAKNFRLLSMLDLTCW